MALLDHEVKIATGRRASDGRVRVSIFADRLLALTLEGHGERAPTLLLTLEQSKRLKEALAELIPLLEEATAETRGEKLETWQGSERRHVED